MPAILRPSFFFLLTMLATTASGLRLTEVPDRSRRRALIGAMGTAAATTILPPPSPVPAAGNNNNGGAMPKTTWRLSGGVEFPILALNTAGLSRDEASLAFRNALEAGISHVEFHPGVERDGVARVLRSSINNKNRESSSVFLTTKIETNWERSPSPKAAAAYVKRRLDEDLAVLGVDAIDMLMLRESTNGDVIRAMWAEMERELDAGRVRSLGVVNYCESALECLLSSKNARRYTPQVNYIQLHAGMGPMPASRAFGEERGIRTFAYGHLGERARPRDDTQQLLENPSLLRIAKARSRTVNEVALRWVLQTGAAASVRPTTDFRLGRGFCTNPRCAEGLRASSRAFEWQLSSEEMKEIDSLTTPDSNPTLFSSPGCPASFFG